MKEFERGIKVFWERSEEGFAVLQFEDGKSVLWPVDKIPSNAKEGMMLEVVFRIP